MSISFLKNIVFFVIGALFFVGNNCFAWIGYENESDAKIEIENGSLLREGEIIRFYDWQLEEDRSAEVISVEYMLDTIRLELYDNVDDKIRIFDVENHH